ncbi:MAG: hypothetical protein ABFS08_09825 [Pseudomonadota bacterium]
MDNARISRALLTLLPQPALSFNKFGFLFMGLNIRHTNHGIAMLGVPHIPSEHKEMLTAILMTCKYRLEKIEGDAYAIAVKTVDANNQQRLIVYTTQKSDEDLLIHDTEIFVNIRHENGEAQLMELSQQDWVMSDPLLIAPDERFRSLLDPLTNGDEQVGSELDRHPAMLMAQQYFNHSCVTTSTIMRCN